MRCFVMMTLNVSPSFTKTTKKKKGTRGMLFVLQKAGTCVSRVESILHGWN